MIEYTFDDGNFSMPDDIYGQILAPLGYPFIGEDELEYPREQIVRLAIVKGLREYFHWCPPIKSEEVPVTRDTQNIGMPNDCYGVVGLSLQQDGGGMSGGGIFGYAAELTLYGGMGTDMGSYFGPEPAKTRLYGQGSYFQNRAVRQAVVNYARRVHYEGPFNNLTYSGNQVVDQVLEGEFEKFITVYSNTRGVLNIFWAKKSLEWTDVEFAQQQNVIDYCSACVKELFANLRRQGTTPQGGFEYGKWLEEASASKTAIVTSWKNLVKSAGIIRGSL